MEEKQQLSANKREMSKVVQYGTGLATLVGGIGLDIAAHGGWSGAIVAGAVALLAAKNSPLLYEGIKEMLPVEFIEQVTRHEAGSRSLVDRLMGYYPDDEPEYVESVVEQQEKIEAKSQPRAQVVPESQLEAIFPAYPEHEILRLGKAVETGQRFDPSINMVLGAGIIFAGSQGSGKSNGVAVVAEHVGRCEMSEILFDMKREYSSLRDVVPNGITAGHPDAAHEIGGRYYPLTLENAASFAAKVMVEGLQAVVDIPSYLCYGGDWNDVVRIITAIIEGLMHWSIEQKPADRLPCLLSFDEAHIFFPQQMEMKQLFDQQTLSKLNVAAFNIVNMGRSYGYTMLFSTQRIANIAKWTIGNCQIKVIMKHSVDTDVKRCEEEVGKEYTTQKEIKMLPSGQGYVIGLTSDPVKILFDLRKSRHDSHTPKIDRIQRRREVQAVDTEPKMPSMEQMQAWLASLPEVDPQDTRYGGSEQRQALPEQGAQQYYRAKWEAAEMAQAQQQQPAAHHAKYTSALPHEVQEALDAYEPGMSYRDLGKKLGIGKDAAGNRIIELKRRKLI